jgi:hypothetical protein
MTRIAPTVTRFARTRSQCAPRQDRNRRLRASALMASVALFGRPLLAKLEPFAFDLWRKEIANWLPPMIECQVA